MAGLYAGLVDSGGAVCLSGLRTRSASGAYSARGHEYEQTPYPRSRRLHVIRPRRPGACPVGD